VIAVVRRCRRLAGSVRVRVTVLAAGLFALALGLASVVLLDALEDRLVAGIRRADRAALQAEADRLLHLGLPAPDGDDVTLLAGGSAVAFPLPSPVGQPIVATATGEISGALAEAGEVVPAERIATGAPVAGPGGALPATMALDAGSARLLGIVGDADRFVVTSVRVGEDLSLSTASSLTAVEDTLDVTRSVLWVLIPTLVGLVAALAWWLVSRALRPVHRLTSAAATITASSLHERVPVPDARDEVAELAATMNSMLDRLERADATTRRLVSDASHELRTPITVIRTELEVARASSAADWDAVSVDVLGEVERLQSMVDDLLLLARLGERAPAEGEVSLLDAARDATARRRRVPVVLVDELGGSADVARGDRDAFARALDHVVANAARHACGRVEVRVARTADGLVVHVDDDGPGIPAADRARVLERFVRLDEARARDAGGSGLGLAVADEVVRSSGGSLLIDGSPLGGARVTLALPAA